jgi:hypothetical protein
MFYRLAADGVLLLHLAFIAFAVLGAVLVARWPRLAFVHLPAAAWGFFVELTGRVCPLTYAENALRMRAGEAGYSESFIEHYLLAVVYPDGLTRAAQLVLAAAVIAINVAIYGWLLHRRSHRSRVTVDGEGKHAA